MSKNEQITTFSFDIGYASIGWSAMRGDTGQACEPEILGTGVVLFQSDDCLASERRSFRGLRRVIRARRQRIERMGKILVQHGCITEEEAHSKGHDAPFFIAARALQGKQKLSALEAWHILRWYAHNRGYDGNSLWANREDGKSAEETKEDAARVQAAKDLAAKYQTNSMAETICAFLNFDTNQETAQFTVNSPKYKAIGAAFDRTLVIKEVNSILRDHSELPYAVVELILGDNKSQTSELAKCDVRFQKRFSGSVLFGQLVPRFDNRIIARCPITWALEYEKALGEGKNDTAAKHHATKMAKVPNANTADFYAYRFARILANLKFKGRPLSAEHRQLIMQDALACGGYTRTSFKKCLEGILGATPDNYSNYFELHPDSDKALMVVPATKKWNDANQGDILSHIPSSIQTKLHQKLERGQGITYMQVKDELLAMGEDPLPFAAAVDLLDKGKKPLWDKAWKADIATGRAPYARPVLKQVVDEVLRGEDPTKPALCLEHPNGEKKAEDGILYELNNPESKVNQYQQQRSIDELSNNHRVRHRMLIFERVLKEMKEKYLGGDKNQMVRICMEVGRELKEFSGIKAKEIEGQLTLRLAHFKKAVKTLEEAKIPVTANLIRKCRIALDMNWKCPFTGMSYGPDELENMEFEHIIPYALRPSNALSHLVLCRPEVNRMKGKRTGLQFVQEDGGKECPGINQSIMTESRYQALVKKLDSRGHADDEKRKKLRKKILVVSAYSQHQSKKKNPEVEDEREFEGFTEGHMTQSSQLMKLAARMVKNQIKGARVLMLPGVVTAATRKAWHAWEVLAEICPEVRHEVSNELKSKDEIRKVTHLHHAVDASVLGMASYIFPQIGNGILWEAMGRRSINEAQKRQLEALGGARFYQFHRKENGRGWQLILSDLPDASKRSLRDALNEKRVVQHIPADMSGSKLEETIYGIEKIEGDMVHMVCKKKETVKKTSKVIGLNSPENSKLLAIKACKIIGGNYGVALDPAPYVLRHHQVYIQLQKLKQNNKGRPIRVLRNGMIIELINYKDPQRNGKWTISSIKENTKKGIVFDLKKPQQTVPTWIDIRLKTLLPYLNVKNSSYLGD